MRFPINKAKKIISDLIQFGEVIPAWIGITVQKLDDKLAGYLKVPGKKGVMIQAVEPRSPARKAGLQEGDIIVAIGKKKDCFGAGVRVGQKNLCRRRRNSRPAYGAITK